MKTSKTSMTSNQKAEISVITSNQNYQVIKQRLEDANFAARYKKLLDLLASDIVSFNESTRKISDNKDSVKQTKKVLFFIPKLDEHATIENIIEQNTQIVSCLKKAITRVNMRFAGLMKITMLIAELENDMYSLIDEQSINSNELRQTLIDIFRAQGISDTQIDSLLDRSFKRANILRERIIGLKEDIIGIRNILDAHVADIGVLQEEQQSIQDALQNQDNVLLQIRNEIETLSSRLSTIDEHEKQISLLADEIRQKADLSELKHLTAIVNTQQTKIAAKVEKTDLDHYIKADNFHNKLKNIWIAYGVTTATLLAGLIASFLI